MERLKKGWKRTPAKVRKPFVFVLGFTVVGTGIILLPLPGPGWVIIFAGFAILATEFAFAERVRDTLVGFLKKSITSAQPAWHRCVAAFKRWLRS